MSNSKKKSSISKMEEVLVLFNDISRNLRKFDCFGKNKGQSKNGDDTLLKKRRKQDMSTKKSIRFFNDHEVRAVWESRRRQMKF